MLAWLVVVACAKTEGNTLPAFDFVFLILCVSVGQEDLVDPLKPHSQRLVDGMFRRVSSLTLWNIPEIARVIRWPVEQGVEIYCCEEYPELEPAHDVRGYPLTNGPAP